MKKEHEVRLGAKIVIVGTGTSRKVDEDGLDMLNIRMILIVSSRK